MEGKRSQDQVETVSEVRISDVWAWNSGGTLGQAEEDVENILEFLNATWPLGEMNFGEMKNENRVTRMLPLTEMKASKKEPEE